MKFVISGKNMEITDGLRGAVEDKLGKLEKYFAPDTIVTATLSVEKERQKIEVTIPVKGTIIRTEQVSDMASRTSTYAQVRVKMVELQRKIAEKNNVVMDGRDIGTVVLPDAAVKVFLTASAEVRALRRYKEMLEANPDLTTTLAEVEADIRERDYRDSHRENSPLRQAEDAVLVDSSDMTLEEVIGAIRRIVEERA